MKRILIVDDDAAVRGAIRHVLQPKGYDLIEAEDGKKALLTPDLGMVDLVITDIVMPEFEGNELITRLRRSHPRMKILALSGSPYALPGKYLDVASILGANATMTKPFRGEELLTTVRSLLADPAAT